MAAAAARALPGRSRAPAVRAAVPARPAARPSVGGAASVQRAIGNRAVHRLMQARAGAPAGAGDPARAENGLESYLAGSAGHGRPLPPATRAYFEPRFNRAFTEVRVHADDHAARAARSVDAQAFTSGAAIHFGAGQYRPGTVGGDRLLAHELTHVVQQSDRAAPSVQRRLVVGGPLDPGDSAASLTPAQRTAMARTLVGELCPGFTARRLPTDEPAAEVVAASTECGRADAVTAAAKPMGCCCLCVMTGSPETWTLSISEELGAMTIGGSRVVVIPPTTSPDQSGHWTAAGARVMRPRVITLGHELCGHAALMELRAHPPAGNRETTDVHDPTINVERAIWLEQGLPARDRRGLASAGLHRGESFNRITVISFPFGVSDISGLPAAEKAKLTLARNIIMTNDRWVEIVGHSDPIGSAAAKQQVSTDRAVNIATELQRLGMNNLPPASSSVTAPRMTRVEGVADREPLTGQPHAEWRRVEIFTSSFAAGMSRPPAGTPTTVTHIGPPATAAGAFRSGDACAKLLIGEAWQRSF
jgi:outer membrane protein OmpA-like peptidoglycan-associated protein